MSDTGPARPPQGDEGTQLKSVCVFCGSSPGGDPDFLEAARRMGRAIAASDRRLVYGGSNIGLMAALASSALDAEGEVVGVLPRTLADMGLAHPHLTTTHVVDSMHERKALMATLSDGFVALPGGLGTLDELFEIWSWAQLGLHAKPIGLLNVNGFYDPLLAFVDRVVEQGFMRRGHRDALIVEAGPDRLLTRLETFQPMEVSKWTGA